jgi:predicted small metal-binding protein
VAKVFECRHGGVVCDAKIEGETEEEVLQKAVEHAREKHGVDLGQARTLARYAQSLVREAPGDRAG